MAILYTKPSRWLRYDPMGIIQELTDAKAAVIALTTLPYQRSWVEALQEVQLKREIAGTSRIEGAEFTDDELEAALEDEGLDELATRSQRQAAASKRAYKWIEDLPSDYPVDSKLITTVHALIVREADDDHCAPGALRKDGENVTFGAPRHRGVNGGEECARVFKEFCRAIRTEFPGQDPLVQALALHYHLAAMHPFSDGNGRTARAVEALMLQKAGLKRSLFIAMSNYYYDEKTGYLRALAEVRAKDHDLTPFLKFGLRGVALQCRRLSAEITHNVRKALFRNVMHDLFGRLQSPRKRVIAKRQLTVLSLLLEGEMPLRALMDRTRERYSVLKDPGAAMVRDLLGLEHLGAIRLEHRGKELWCAIRPEWPTEITETEFFQRLMKLPKAKTHRFPGSG